MGLLNWDHKRRIRNLQRQYAGQVPPESVEKHYRTTLETVTPIFTSAREGTISLEYALSILCSTHRSLERQAEGYLSAALKVLLPIH